MIFIYYALIDCISKIWFFIKTDLSNVILAITAIIIAWQAWETRRLAELTRIIDEPLLDINFGDRGAELSIVNIGKTPAYSPSISALEISPTEHFEFDPLHNSKSSIIPGEERKVWMHHQIITKGSIGGFMESMPVLRKFLNERDPELPPIKLIIQYFNKNGRRLSRKLYVRISGNHALGNQHIYTSTGI